jgi:hypothetical protein
MLIEFDVSPGKGVYSPYSASTTIGIINFELEKWSERYQIACHIKRRKNTITLCFDDDKHYLFFGLTFDPKPTYTSGKPMTDFECPWRLLTDHEVQHRQKS